MLSEDSIGDILDDRTMTEQMDFENPDTLLQSFEEPS